jgi:hypothetical protein
VAAKLNTTLSQFFGEEMEREDGIFSQFQLKFPKRSGNISAGRRKGGAG